MPDAMRKNRIYQSPGNYSVGDNIALHNEAGQHVAVVLRMQPGQKLTLFCGDNREFEAVISTIHKKKVSVTLLAEFNVNRESNRIIHLAQAISKGDRMDMVVQKAVELGVTSITPIVTQRCVLILDNERKEKKRNQWQAIAIAACEQSGRNTVPTVHPILSLMSYLGTIQTTLNFVLHPDMKSNWRNYEYNQSDIGLVIGPEGGLVKQEIQLLLEFGFLPFCLGPRILRTETAAIAALSVLQAICGDL